MKKIYFLSVIVVMILTLASCASPIIQRQGKNVEIADQLFQSSSNYDANKPIIYTIDTTYIKRLFDNHDPKMLNLQNYAQYFGIAKGKTGSPKIIKGVAGRPFDIFQADIKPGTNIIQVDEAGKPKLKPLFRINTIPKIGFNMFVKTDQGPKLVKKPLKETDKADEDVEESKTTLPQKGGKIIRKRAVEYMLKAVSTTKEEDQADNRFRQGTMYELSWDKEAYPHMYKIVQYDHYATGKKLEVSVKDNSACQVIDIRYGDYVRFYYLDNGKPTIALYNFDKPDALSLIGLEPTGRDGWFLINPLYNNYHGSGWLKHGENENQEDLGQDQEENDSRKIKDEQKDNEEVQENEAQENEVQENEAQENEVQYWDYPHREPLIGKGGPRRLTKKIISRDYPQGRILFSLDLLKLYSPNFFNALWQKGWIYPYQDTFNIAPQVLKKYFPEAMKNLDKMYPGSWEFIPTKALKKRSRKKYRKTKSKSEKVEETGEVKIIKSKTNKKDEVVDQGIIWPNAKILFGSGRR